MRTIRQLRILADGAKFEGHHGLCDRLGAAADYVEKLENALRSFADEDCYSGNDICRLQDEALGTLETLDDDEL